MATTEKGLAASLNARIVGSGTDETIVFGHGYGTNQSIWDEIVPLLAQNYRLVLFDWPFSGTVKDENLYDPLKYSSLEGYADDLITLLNETSLKHVTFVAHSMSGMIGCFASIKSPHLFKRLVLVGSSPRYLNSDDYEGGFNNTDIEQMLSNIEGDYENFASTYATLASGPMNGLYAENFEKCIKEMGAEVALSLAKTVFYSDCRDILDKVETPCTIILTNKDVAAPHSVALYMRNKIKGKVTLEIIDTIGHFPQLNMPHEFVQVLKNALES